MKSLTAKDVMSRQVLMASPDMTVHELAVFLTENQISGAPVVDDRGKLIGLVSLTDIAESDALRDEVPEATKAERREWAGKASRDEVGDMRVQRADLLVRDIMTPAAYTVPEDTPVARLAQTMVAGRIHRLVVTNNHRVSGIVTSLDLLRLLCEKPDGGRDLPGGRDRTVIVR
ncbi:MAG TPA: CBS domain-containing protein [Vicinamibacteria bacterium]|jgi:CBS domain-containing protein